MTVSYFPRSTKRRIFVSLVGTILAAMLLLSAGPAHATCPSPLDPGGVAEGVVVYNDDYDVVQFCDGTNWISMAGGNDSRIGTIGSAGQWCSTDGTVINCNNAAPSSVAGIDKQVQFNSSGAMAGAAQMLWDSGNNRLTVGSTTASSTAGVAVDVVGNVTSNAIVLKTVGGMDAPVAGAGGGITAMSKAARDALSSPLEGMVIYQTTDKRIEWFDGTSWVHFSGGSGGGGNTMVSGWPDAIMCNVTGGPWGVAGPAILYLNLTPYSPDGKYYYRIVSNSAFDGHIGFNPDGSHHITTGLTTSDCSAGSTIAGLYSAGKAFNFVGGATASADGSAGQVQFNEGGDLKADAALHWDNTNKRLGIGTATPDGKFTVNAGSGSNTSFDVSNPASLTLQLSHYITTTGGSSERKALSAIQGLVGSSDISNYQGSLAFLTTPGTGSGVPTERMRINASGNVGIGTSSPTALLHIADTSSTGTPGLRITGSGDQVVAQLLDGHNGAGMETGILGLFHEGTQNVHLNAVGPSYILSGNVGVGTATPNQGKVEVKGGTVCVDTNSDDNATSCIANESDARLKANVQDITYSLDALMKLRPVSFDWKHGDPEVLKNYPLIARFADRPHSIGLIAQEVQEVVPEAIESETVGDNNARYLQLDYAKLVPVLIKGIQELKAANDNLRDDLSAANDSHVNEIRALREEIKALKAAIQ